MCNGQNVVCIYIYIMYYIYIWGYGHPTIMIGIPSNEINEYITNVDELMTLKMLVAKPIIHYSANYSNFRPWIPWHIQFLGDTRHHNSNSILHPASSSVKYLGGSGQGMTWPEALEIRMASPSSVKVKPTSVGKQPFGHLAISSWLQLLLTDGI